MSNFHRIPTYQTATLHAMHGKHGHISWIFSRVGDNKWQHSVDEFRHLEKWEEVNDTMYIWLALKMVEVNSGVENIGLYPDFLIELAHWVMFDPLL